MQQHHRQQQQRVCMDSSVRSELTSQCPCRLLALIWVLQTQQWLPWRVASPQSSPTLRVVALHHLLWLSPRLAIASLVRYVKATHHAAHAVSVMLATSLARSHTSWTAGLHVCSLLTVSRFFSTVCDGRYDAAVLAQIAKRQAVVNPENTFFSVKRFVGRRMSEVTEECKQVPYVVSPGGSAPCRGNHTHAWICLPLGCRMSMSSSSSSSLQCQTTGSKFGDKIGNRHTVLSLEHQRSFRGSSGSHSCGVHWRRYISGRGQQGVISLRSCH